MTAGEQATFTVSVTALHGFASAVSLSVAGLPSGASGTFSPAAVSGAGISELTVTTAIAMPTGSYALTVSGSSGSLTHNTGAVLVVNAPPTQTTVHPASTTIQTGTVGGGTAADLGADDARLFSVNAAGFPRVAAWYGTLTGVSNSLGSLRITYKGRNSLPRSQTVAVWNWTTSAWVELDARTVGNTDMLLSDLLPPGAPGVYVSGTAGPGDVRVRIRSTGGFSNYFSSGNLLKAVWTA